MSKVKVNKEIMQKILYLDCRDKENIRRLKKSLMRLPFIKEKDDLATDNLERIVSKLESKYKLRIGYVMRHEIDGLTTLSAMIKTTKKGKWLVTINAISIWEIYAKTVFYYFYYVQERKRRKEEGRQRR